MKRFLAILILTLVLLSVFPFSAVAADKPWGSVEFNKHYYRFYNTPMTYSEAKAFCESEGGHIVTITSAAENEFVTSIIDCEAAWLGGNDVAMEGRFVWDTNEFFSYSNWADGEPNNAGPYSSQNHMRMYRNGTWDDIEEDATAPFVCEWDSYKDNTQINIPSDATTFNGHSYVFFFDKSFTWDVAAEYCARMGGHLVTISSDEENVFVNSLCYRTDIWIGASDIEEEGTFKWVNGEKMDYTLWADGEPNNGSGNQDYAHMYTNGTWDDGYNNSSLPFVCEWDFVCVSSSGKGFPYHVWGLWEDSPAATCETDGMQTRVCKTCNAAEFQTVYATGHSYSERTRVSGNVFIPPIVEEEKCIHCGGAIRYEIWDFVWVPIVSVIAILIVIIVVIAKIRG